MFRFTVMFGVAIPMACTVWAQQEPQQEPQQPVTIVATGVGESAEVASTIPVAERRPVVSKAWQQLGHLVQRKPDGSAKALHRTGKDETWVQWKNLRIVSVSDAGVSNADLEKGVTRRYYCEIASDSYRVWNPRTISWSAWQPGSYEPFPWRVEVSWEGRQWIARVDEHEGQFIAPDGGGSRSGGTGIFRVATDGSLYRVAMR